MIKALLMIFAPAQTWERIARARRSLVFVFFLYLLPTIVLAILGELDGRIYLSELWPDNKSKPPTPELILRYGAAEVLIGVLIAFVCARLLKTLSVTFHNRNTYAQCFTVIAYGLGPFYLLHLLNAIPHLNPWIPLAAGVVFSVAAMYSAIPHILKPDPPHAFGLFLMTGILLAALCGLARFFTLQILHGRIVLP